jgi:hypothetical protein
MKLPMKWTICPTCRGNGAHSLALGAITEEDRERDWSPEMEEDYFAGGYDRTCDPCEGTGKVEVVDRVACRYSPKLIAMLKEYDADARVDAEDEALYESERRFGC